MLVTPPLLRDSLMTLAGREKRDEILVYLMEPRLAPELAAWSDRRPGVRLHAFAPVEPHRHSPALTFHGLSGRAFLERMAVARGVVCTAGFETVSEAMWLGTPAFMVPTPGHYEQRCNAADAAAVGAGLVGESLDLDPFLEYLDHHAHRPRPIPPVGRARGGPRRRGRRAGGGLDAGRGRRRPGRGRGARAGRGPAGLSPAPSTGGPSTGGLWLVAATGTGPRQSGC